MDLPRLSLNPPEGSPLASPEGECSPEARTLTASNRRGLSSASASTEKYCFAIRAACPDNETRGILDDISGQLCASHWKKNTQVDISMLSKLSSPDVSMSLPEDAFAILTDECDQVKLEMSLLRAESEELKSQLKSQRQDIKAIQVGYQSEVSELHRELSALRSLLRSPQRDSQQSERSKEPCCQMF
jgi:hypothetical protein